MALKTCPFCGHTEDDNKEYRLAIYMGDQRIVVIPPGHASIKEALNIVRKTPNTHLMQEALQDGRIIYSKFVGTSNYETNENGKVVKKCQGSQ